MYNLEPITEHEKILAILAGRHYDVSPKTREEAYLLDIAERYGRWNKGRSKKNGTDPGKNQQNQK